MIQNSNRKVNTFISMVRAETLYRNLIFKYSVRVSSAYKQYRILLQGIRKIAKIRHNLLWLQIGVRQ